MKLDSYMILFTKQLKMDQREPPYCNRFLETAFATKH